MSLVNINQYEIKNSRTDQKVPVVNGVLLHSIYNPVKEAESIVEKHLEALQGKSEVLILGLGFAYHVNEVIKKLEEKFNDSFKVIVIEPNLNIYNDCVNNGLLNKKNVLVYAGFTASELYSDIDFVHFLLRKPTVIAHPPSFNLFQLYFKSILGFEAPKTLKDTKEFITNSEVRSFLNSFEENKTFKEVIQSTIPEKQKLSDLDFLSLALNELSQKSKIEAGTV